MLKPFFDHFAGTFDVLLASHEDEDVAWWMRQVDLESLLDSAVNVVFAWRLAEKLVHRESPTRNSEGGSVIVEGRELGCIHGSGGNDKLEISPSGQNCIKVVSEASS